MRETREEGPRLEPIGSVDGDVSPYGVRDMAGLIREWCGGWFGELVGQRAVRGSSWSEPAETCLATLERGVHNGTTADNLGFRPLLELDDDQV
jgi:formylglycine-generating enzyme required for sulfatase activity